MEKLGIAISSDHFEDYRPISPDRLLMMPLGTMVIVKDYGIERPYRIVRWGKHKRKRLQWMGWLDYEYSTQNPYLPIRKTRYLQFMTKKKPGRLTVRQAFSG